MKEAIQKIVENHNRASKPTTILVGEVISPPPELKIKVAGNDKLIIEKEALLVAESLTRHSRIVTLEHFETADRDLGDYMDIDYLHTDDLKAPWTSFTYTNLLMRFNDVLKVGDKVILARSLGGQNYTVLDRAVSYDNHNIDLEE